MQPNQLMILCFEMEWHTEKTQVLDIHADADPKVGMGAAQILGIVVHGGIWLVLSKPIKIEGPLEHYVQMYKSN